MACCPYSPGRRDSLKTLAIAALAFGGTAHGADDGPQAGDALTLADADDATPLRVDDLKRDAKQLIVYPYDLQAKRVRYDSRLNKILLIRVDPGELDAENRSRAADGVLAFSAICTHQGCDVNAWRAAEKTLLCFCHFSQFQPLEGAAVISGPAPRPLPALPLKQVDGRLVVAGPFTRPPGVGG